MGAEVGGVTRGLGVKVCEGMSGGVVYVRGTIGLYGFDNEHQERGHVVGVFFGWWCRGSKQMSETTILNMNLKRVREESPCMQTPPPQSPVVHISTSTSLLLPPPNAD